MPSQTLFLESVAGIAGDMFTAAFLDAGLVDPEVIRSVPGALNLTDVGIEITETERASVRATQVRVVGPRVDGKADHHHVGETEHSHGSEGHDHHTDHHHHHYPLLVRQIEDSGLDSRAKDFALKVFHLLAEAEAHSHGVPIEKVAFHEVGAVDSVVDVAMAGVCVSSVSPDRVLASPIKLGRGTIRIQHGTYPVPPPASARLAIGMPVDPVPDPITRPNVELSTPTGLAILKALDPSFVEGWPRGILRAQGSGTGTMDLGEVPNVFRVALFEAAGATTVGDGPSTDPGWSSLPYEADRVVEIRCNLDDQTGERMAWLMEEALAKGALDAWITPILGKKGRPAALITLLATPSYAPSLGDFLLRLSTTFGIRFSTWDRMKLVREMEKRETPRGSVRFKVGRTSDGQKVKEKAEFEDLKKIWAEDPDFEP
jgi:uncharacterized protein (TIGR00299 family) protein